MSMGKLTAVAYNVQVNAHLAEWARVGVVLAEDDVLTRFFNSLDVSRFQEVLTAVNTRHSIYQESYGDMSRLRDFLNRGREEGGGHGFDYDERTVTLEPSHGAVC